MLTLIPIQTLNTNPKFNPNIKQSLIPLLKSKSSKVKTSPKRDSHGMHYSGYSYNRAEPQEDGKIGLYLCGPLNEVQFRQNYIQAIF